MTEDVREQLLEASSATKKAFNSYRREADPEDHFTSADGQPSTGDKNQDEGEMSFVIVIMQPILRFLQLLCENHNRDLQVRHSERLTPSTHCPSFSTRSVSCGFLLFFFVVTHSNDFIITSGLKSASYASHACVFTASMLMSLHGDFDFLFLEFNRKTQLEDFTAFRASWKPKSDICRC